MSRPYRLMMLGTLLMVFGAQLAIFNWDRSHPLLLTFNLFAVACVSGAVYFNWKYR